jgi:hypothetical protein
MPEENNMNDATHQYIKTLNKKTLVEIIESLAFAAGFEINHGLDPAGEGHTVYGVHPDDGSFTLAGIDSSSFDGPIDGCGCKQSPPCKGCAKVIDDQGCSDDERGNILNLYKVYTIDERTVETGPVYIMAADEDDAATLFHRARSRDFDNERCEVVVCLVQQWEVCDE